MRVNDRRGVTLIESLIAMALVATCLIGILGTFIISKLAVNRTKHRMMAMNTIRAYMEQEIKAGHLGGYVTGNYYVSVANGDPITFLIDPDEGLYGTITANPYPANTYETGTAPNICRYKQVGFVAQWVETKFGSGATCNERAAAYVADHT